MSVLYILLLLIAFKVVDISTQVAFSYARAYFHQKNRERKDPSFKRLTTDVSFEIHRQVSDMAELRQISLRDYIMGAIMTRLKYDTTRMENKFIRIDNHMEK